MSSILSDWLYTEIFIAWCNDFPQLFNCVTRAEVQSTLSLAPLRMATYKSTLPVLQSPLSTPLPSLQSPVCCLKLWVMLSHLAAATNYAPQKRKRERESVKERDRERERQVGWGRGHWHLD